MGNCTRRRRYENALRNLRTRCNVRLRGISEIGKKIRTARSGGNYLNDRLLNNAKKDDGILSWITFLSFLLIVVFVITLVNSNLFLRVQVCGPSMNNTLYGGVMQNGTYIGGDILLAVKNRKPDRGDIVVIDGKKRLENGSYALIIKRVIGIGGDTIKITKDGEVYRNGEKLNETYIVGKTVGSAITGVWSEEEQSYLYRVPEQQYFYLGDNRENSTDSRSPYAYCSEEQIVGVVPEWSVSVKGVVTFFTEAFLPIGNFFRSIFGL